MQQINANGVKLIETADGSMSLYLEHLNETYHSTNGALTESLHVFIEAGLNHFSNIHQNKTNFSIFEVGLGTGLNAYLSALWANKHQKKITFQSIEKYPLVAEVINKLNYSSSTEQEALFVQIHQSQWEQKIQLNNWFDLTKNNADILEPIFQIFTCDIVYFDAFGAKKQPEMWSLEVLEKCCTALTNQGVFVTYAATGQLKRNLKALGMEVESIPGPRGKREMTRAIKI